MPPISALKQLEPPSPMARVGLDRLSGRLLIAPPGLSAAIPTADLVLRLVKGRVTSLSQFAANDETGEGPE